MKETQGELIEAYAAAIRQNAWAVPPPSLDRALGNIIRSLHTLPPLPQRDPRTAEEFRSQLVATAAGLQMRRIRARRRPTVLETICSIHLLSLPIRYNAVALFLGIILLIGGLLLGSWFLEPGSHNTVVAPTLRPAEGNGTLLSTLLNPDGTLNLACGFSGTLDQLSVWRMEMDAATGTPRFVPARPVSLITGVEEWDIRFAFAGIDSAINADAINGPLVYIGGSFTTAGGATAWKAGARSNQVFLNGSGSVQARIVSTKTYMAFGLSHANTDQPLNDIDYAFSYYTVPVYKFGGTLRWFLGPSVRHLAKITWTVAH